MSNVLKVGDIGLEVAEIKNYLLQALYDRDEIVDKDKLKRELSSFDPVHALFTKDTETYVKLFQKITGLLVVDGLVGPKTKKLLHTWNLKEGQNSVFLTEADIKDASEQLGVEPAILKAVNEVESNGSGFVGDKPKILFEGHIFYRLLRDKVKDINDLLPLFPGNILYKNWIRKYYIGGSGEYDRLDSALYPENTDVFEYIEHNELAECAYGACSWGLFQIMGYHWKSLGYSTIFEWVSKMRQNEGEQLKALIKFLEVNGIIKFLKTKDWHNFARRYNGPGYLKNNYHIKLENAYRKYSSD